MFNVCFNWLVLLKNPPDSCEEPGEVFLFLFFYLPEHHSAPDRIHRDTKAAVGSRERATGRDHVLDLCFSAPYGKRELAVLDLSCCGKIVGRETESLAPTIEDGRFDAIPTLSDLLHHKGVAKCVAPLSAAPHAEEPSGIADSFCAWDDFEIGEGGFIETLRVSSEMLGRLRLMGDGGKKERRRNRCKNFFHGLSPVVVFG